MNERTEGNSTFLHTLTWTKLIAKHSSIASGEKVEREVNTNMRQREKERERGEGGERERERGGKGKFSFLCFVY